MKTIDCFDGEYAFLSNFYEAPIVVNGVTYPTNEHFFQAMKTEDETMQKMIAGAPTPGKAKRLGRQVALRANWDETRLGWMQVGLRAKFTQHPELLDKLIATGDALLIEGNYWHDTYWGQCDGVGENQLGALLMMLRDEYTKPHCHWDDSGYMPCELQARDCSNCEEYFADREVE